MDAVRRGQQQQQLPQPAGQPRDDGGLADELDERRVTLLAAWRGAARCGAVRCGAVRRDSDLKRPTQQKGQNARCASAVIQA